MTELVLLHGALGSSDQFTNLHPLLYERFDCYYPDFEGHGGKPDSNKTFSIDGFGNQLLAFLEAKNLRQPDIFGFSMGGYVATYLATRYPEKLGRIVTLGTKWQWDQETAAKEVKMLNPDKIEAKVPQFADRLQKRHAPLNWKNVTLKTANMLEQMGENPPLTEQDFRKVSQKVHLMLGDQDEMVSREETEIVNQNLPDSDFTLLPDTPHPLEKVEPALVCDKLCEYLIHT